MYIRIIWGDEKMKKLHKVTGWLFIPVLVWMGLTGIVLNHRKAFSGYDVSRDILPADYAYRNWNYGFFKSSLSLSGDTVLLYGNEGVWLSDREGRNIREYNAGMVAGADNRKVCRLAAIDSTEVYCATLFRLYRLNRQADCWEETKLPRGIDRIADLESKDDTLVVLTRSELLTRSSGEPEFRVTHLSPGPDLGKKRSLFRVLWALHGGKLFGILGKIVVDVLAVVFFFFLVF